MNKAGRAKISAHISAHIIVLIVFSLLFIVVGESETIREMAGYVFYMEPSVYKGAVWLSAIVIAACIWSVGYYIAFGIIDKVGICGVRNECQHGCVINKYYTPERTSVGVGTAYVPQNQSMGAVMTINHVPETFTLELQWADGAIERLAVNEAVFDEYTVGERISVVFKRSFTTGYKHMTGEFVKAPAEVSQETFEG
jgi:hypothetical protein